MKFRTTLMNRQRFLHIVLAAFIQCSYGTMAHAQGFNAVEKIRNAYRMGDRMTGRQLLVGNVAGLLNDSICDLSQTQVANDRYTCRYGKGPNNGMVSRLEHGTRYFFEQKGDSLLIMGFENHLAKIDYDLPELWLKFPMHAGDSLSGLYHGCGLYGERWNVRKLGDYKTRAKLCRTMVLPEGDTLRNVLRLHTQRQVCTLNSPARMPGDSLPHFTPDSIRWHLANNKGVLVENVYRWYVAGWRYPILEAYVTGGTQSQAPLFTTAFYYSPREQECLFDDNPNTLIRKAVTQQEANGHALVDNDKELDYKVSVDSERKTIRLTYNLERETHVRLILSDNAGIVYKTSERKDVPGKTHVQEIGYGMLPRGRYVLYINANGKRYAEKFKH